MPLIRLKFHVGLLVSQISNISMPFLIASLETWRPGVYFVEGANDTASIGDSASIECPELMVCIPCQMVLGGDNINNDIDVFVQFVKGMSSIVRIYNM